MHNNIIGTNVYANITDNLLNNPNEYAVIHVTYTNICCDTKAGIYTINEVIYIFLKYFGISFPCLQNPYM